MSNTSTGKSPTSQTSKKRLIIDEIGRDTKTGIIGRGYSPDNGKTFYVLDTIYGRLYGANDINAIWNNGTSDRVKKEVDAATAEIPAVKSAADEAVKKADSAIDSSKVNSDAIVAQSEAISEVKAAMDSATAEIQQTASNAASDAAKIRADVAQVQNEVDTAKAANSASVEALKSDVSAAKQDLADVHDSLTKAQAAAEESQKAIDNSIAQINSDIEQDRKDIASAQQANDDTAKQLDTYSKQAQDQGKTIKSIQDKQDGFTATLADVQGNVTQVSDKVDGLSASLKDAQGNVTSVKAQADQLSATLTDHAKSIATLTASAKELSSTLEDADGRLSKVEQTAQTNSSTLSDVQGDLSQVKQDASTLTATLKDAQGNISTLQQKADSVSAQLASAQGDIASLQTDVTGIKATLVSHEGDIHTLQADSKSLHDSMQDAQGDISTLKKTSTDVTSELKDHDGRMSKAEQTASTLVNEFADQQGHLNRVEQKAAGTEQTVANQQGQINSIQTDVSGVHQTITGQGNQIANINMTLNGLNTKYESVEKSGDELKNRLNNLSVGTRNLLHDTSDQYRTLAGSGRLEKSTASNIYTSVANYHSGDYFTYAATITNSSTKNAMLEVCLLDGNKNPLSASGQAYPVLIHSNSVAPGLGNDRKSVSFRITSNTWFIRTCLVFDGGDAPAGSQIQVKDERLVEGSMAGTWSPNPTDVADKITTNSTQINQNKKAITLKADQTTVDNLSGEVSQNKAQLKVQADQISSKVSSTDFKTLNDKVTNMKIGGRNLLTNTGKDISVTSHTTDGWPAWANVDTGFSFEHGKTYTFSVEAKNSTNKVPEASIRVFENSTNTEVGIYAFPADNNRHSVTFAIPNDSHDYHLLLYAGHAGFIPGVDVTTTYHHPKLEKGNVATDWTPAPEDTITAIQKNSTAIDQTNQKISLKADQTEVDQIKNTVSQNSSQLGVMANEIQSKVTSTDVNNIVNGKGYTTTSTVQSLIDQKAGTINESITKLSNEFDTRNGINLLTGTADFSGNWFNKDTSWFTSEDWLPPEAKNKVYRDANHAWYGLGQAVNLDVGTYTFSMWIYTQFTGSQSMTIYAGDNQYGGTAQLNVTQGFSYSANQQQNAWIKARFYFTVTKAGIVVVRPELNQSSGIFHVASYKLEKGTNPNPVWSPAPSDEATVTQVQQITASIDGIQSTVANKADKSQITQLSNVIQSKVSSSDFNDLKDKTLWKSTDSIDLNTAVSQQKIFVKGGSNLPPGSYWWYVRVEPGYASRIAQYAVSDRDNIHYSRQYDGKQWTAWSQGATESEITQLRDDINLRVKSGDLLSQINLTAHNTLIQSNKIYLDSSSTVFSGKAFIPSAAITSLEADKITTGTLNGIEIRQLETGGRSIDIKNGNIAIASNDPYEPRISFTNNGKDAKMFNAVGDIEVLNQEFTLFNFTPEDTHSLNPIPFFKVTNTGQIGSGGAQLNMDHAIFDGYEWWTPSAGVTFGRTWNGVDKSSDYADIYAKSFVPHSELSAKTRIKKLDRKEALDKIMQDNMYTYQFKEDVRDGVSKRYASFIIDNIHDVAQYTEPEEFLSANGKGRDDGTQLAYLIAAVQYQQEQIEELKKKLEEK